jgi:hypothetical protein
VRAPISKSVLSQAADSLEERGEMATFPLVACSPA